MKTILVYEFVCVLGRNVYNPLPRSETILTNFTVDSKTSMDYLRDLGLHIADVAASSKGLKALYCFFFLVLLT